MATEPLEYKVTFDTSEVAQKLAEVKNSMDVAFGAQAFNAAGPDAYPFQAMFNSPALTAAKDGVAMAQNTFGGIQSAFNTMAETSRLGYSKFTRDLEMTGLMAGSMRGAPQTLTYGQQMQEIREGGWLDDVTGGMGIGYSPTMAMSKSEYTRAYRKEGVADFMEPSWGEAGGAAFGLGMAAAFTAGPVGWTAAALPAVALGAKAALYPFTSELRHQRALEGYVGGTSWRFLSGEFNKGDREDLGQFLRELPKQDSIAARDYSRGEVDEMLSTFTETGGYDYVRTAQDYKEKTKQLFDGHRQLMHTLHIASKEATTLMGQLSRDLGVENFAGFSAEIGALAAGAGLTGTEAATFVMKSSEMVRGTGYNMKDFSLSAGRMLQDVQGMAKAGIISDEDLRQFGGVQGITMNMARSAMNYAGSPTGFVTSAALASAQLGGGDLADLAGMGFQERLGRTAGYLSSPWKILTNDPQKGAEQMGPQLLMMDKTKTFLDEIGSMFGDRKMTGRELEMAARNSDRYSAEEARQMRYIFEAGAFAGSDEDLATRRAQDDAVALQYYRQIQEEGESPFGKGLRRLGAGLSEDLWDPLTGAAEDLYIGIEDRYRSVQRRTSSLIHDVTGGAFATETSQPQGVIAALEGGKNYAKKHDRAMSMDAAQRTELSKKIAAIGGDSRTMVRQTKQVGGSQANIATYGGGVSAGTMVTSEMVDVSQLKKISDVRQTTTDILENYGDDADTTFEDLGLWGILNPVMGTIQLASGIFKSNATMRSIEATSEALKGVSATQYQTQLARSAYYAFEGYEALSDEEKKKTSRLGFTRKSMGEDIEGMYGKQLGWEALGDAISFVDRMPADMQNALIKQGFRESEEDARTRREEMEKVARKSLLKDKYLEEWLTPEVVGGRVTEYINRPDYYKAQRMGVDPEKTADQQKASETYNEYFESRYKVSPEEMMTRTTDAGGTEFSPEGAKAVEAAAAQRTVELLTQFVSGGGAAIPIIDVTGKDYKASGVAG
jgi:hypothetical protein